MTNINELKILELIKFKKNKLAILHCISDYPTKIKDTKLGAIDQIKKFGCSIGFSDHTKDSSAAIASIAKGATIIEKHITLDNNMEGPDHKASLEVRNLVNLLKIL